jgi:imidazolonepropionase
MNKMNYLIKDITNLVTCKSNSKNPKKGNEQSEIGLITDGNVFIENEKITFAGNKIELKNFLNTKKTKYEIIDGKNKTVMPGFIDSHTHLVFAGSRANEYEMRIKGSTYEEIAKAGGGIASTVYTVRNSNKNELLALAEKRLLNFLKYGTTTLEAKSGYGLDVKNEIKMLEVINKLNEKNKYGLNILPTFLGAHSIPKGMSKKDYIDLICFEMIPLVAKKKLAKFIDVFCEVNYFDAKDAESILSLGSRFGLIPRIHTDQFNSIGGIDVAIRVNAISVDHLEVLKSKDIKKLAGKKIIATLLPGTSYFLNLQYQPARELIENNVPVALATDFNPGSCNTENLQIIMSLASLKMKMSAEEIINAVTINSAYSLFLQNYIGSIEKNKYADLLIFDFPSFKDLLYNFAVNQLEFVFKKGKKIKISQI